MLSHLFLFSSVWIFSFPFVLLCFVLFYCLVLQFLGILWSFHCFYLSVFTLLSSLHFSVVLLLSSFSHNGLPSVTFSNCCSMNSLPFCSICVFMVTSCATLNPSLSLLVIIRFESLVGLPAFQSKSLPFYRMLGSLLFSYIVDAFLDHHCCCMKDLFSMWHDFSLSVPLLLLLPVLYKNK